MNYKHLLFKIVSNCLKTAFFTHLESSDYISGDGVDERSLIFLRPTECQPITGNGVRISQHALEEECHLVSAWEWLNNPKMKYMLGFACVDHVWYMHSFLIDTNGCIVEPTPIVREFYWGRECTLEETYFLIAEQLSRLRKNNFPISEKHLKILLNYTED